MAGRGVDILLGGNPEGLARDQLRKEDIDLTDIPQGEWIDALDMLSHGENPANKYSERWAEVLTRSTERPSATSSSSRMWVACTSL